MENNLPVKVDDFMNTKKSKFNVTDAAYAMLLFIVFNMAFSLILNFSGITYSSGSFVYFLLSFVVEALFAVVSVVVAATRRKNLVEAAGLNKKINGKMVFLCFLTSLICLVMFGDITSVFLQILSILGYKSILGGIEMNNFAQYIGYVITTCFVAAFSEEILFRGTILSGLKKYGVKIAVIVSALIFTLMHGNAEQTVHQFIIGLLIGYIFFVTGNFWIGFFIHFFNNFISITEVFILTLASSNQAEVAETAAVQVTWLSLVFNIIAIILFAWAGLYFVKLIYKKLVSENEKLNGKKPEIENASTVIVDGGETEIEMAVDGKPVVESVSEESDENSKENGMTRAATIMFILSGLYLVANWVVHLAYGFMI